MFWKQIRHFIDLNWQIMIMIVMQPLINIPCVLWGWTVKKKVILRMNYSKICQNKLIGNFQNQLCINNVVINSTTEFQVVENCQICRKLCDSLVLQHLQYPECNKTFLLFIKAVGKLWQCRFVINDPKKCCCGIALHIYKIHNHFLFQPICFLNIINNY